MAENTKVTTWKVSADSPNVDHYYVSLWASGAITCSCPHYVHRLAGTVGTCKHIDRALDGQFLEETNHVQPTQVQKVVTKVRRAALKVLMG